MSVRDEQFTLHHHLWRALRRLPRIVRVWLGLAVLVGVVELGAHLGGADEAQQVSDAVGAVVRIATGPDPASDCLQVVPADLPGLVSELGGPATAPGAPALAACRARATQLHAEATPGELADLAGGHVQTVQLRTADSAIVVYVARDRRLGASLTMVRQAGRWLIDAAMGGQFAGAT